MRLMLRRFGELLAVRDFRSLLFSTTLSQLGDRLTHMLLITLIAVARPGRMLGYSEGALTFVLPTLLLSPFVGVLVDRWDKRRVIAVTHFVQSGIFLVTPVLIWLTGSFVPFWVALAVFFGLDLFNNTACPALLPALAGPDRILHANAVSTTFARAATVVGMLVGGFLVRWVGWRPGLVINAMTHLGAGLVALGIATRLGGTTAPSGTLGRALRSAAGRFLGELAAVFGVVRRSPLVAFVMASIVVSTFVSAVSYTLLIFLVQQVLGLGTAGVGVFAGILAVGMIGGALSIGFVRRNLDRPLVVSSAVLLYGLLFVAGRFHVSVPFLVVTALAAGVSFSWLGVVQNTILQEEVAEGIRGRVFSTREFVINATFLLSTLLVGTLGDLTSWRVAMPAIGVVLVLLAAGGFWFSLSRARSCCR